MRWKRRTMRKNSKVSQSGSRALLQAKGRIVERISQLKRITLLQQVYDWRAPTSLAKAHPVQPVHATRLALAHKVRPGMGSYCITCHGRAYSRIGAARVHSPRGSLDHEGLRSARLPDIERMRNLPNACMTNTCNVCTSMRARAGERESRH